MYCSRIYNKMTAHKNFYKSSRLQDFYKLINDYYLKIY